MFDETLTVLSEIVTGNSGLALTVIPTLARACGLIADRIDCASPWCGKAAKASPTNEWQSVTSFIAVSGEGRSRH